MPYYLNVTARHTIESLDYLYDEVKKENQIFYPIYPNYPKNLIKEKEELKDTGLFSLEVRKKLLLP